MTNKKVLFKVLLTVSVLLALASNFLPLLQADLFGFGASIAAKDFFDMDLLEELLGYSSQTNVVAILKAIIVSLAALNLFTVLSAWAFKPKTTCIIGVISGMLQTGFWLFIMICAFFNETTAEILDYGVSFGLGMWGFITSGILMIILSVLLLKCNTRITANALPEQGALLGVAGEYAGAKIPVGDIPVIFGRDPGNCHIILNEKNISRKHCSVVYDATKKAYIVRDFSSNGTFDTDGKRISEIGKAELHSGDTISIGMENVFSLI